VWLFLAGAYTIVFGDNMNEQIKQLFEQAGTDVSGKWMSVDNAEKFAELIVRKCLYMIENEASTYAEPVWAVELVNDIREHFGVEE